MQKKAAIIYIVCIHVVLVTVLIKSNFIYQVKIKLGVQAEEITEYYRSMFAFHLRVDQNLPPESIIFIGDSHTQGLAVSAISPSSVNYGIGGDTTIGVMKRLPYYRSLSESKAVVLTIGFNDLGRRNNNEITDNIEKLLKYFQPNLSVILCAIPPVGKKEHKTYNHRIKELNASMRKMTMNYSHISYVDSFNGARSSEGYLLSEYHLSDGIHLSKQGYNLWITQLINTLNKIKEQ